MQFLLKTVSFVPIGSSPAETLLRTVFNDPKYTHLLFGRIVSRRSTFARLTKGHSKKEAAKKQRKSREEDKPREREEVKRITKKDKEPEREEGELGEEYQREFEITNAEGKERKTREKTRKEKDRGHDADKNMLSRHLSSSERYLPAALSFCFPQPLLTKFLLVTVNPLPKQLQQM